MPAERDGSITIGDIGAVVLHFGTAGDPDIDPLSPTPSSGYHTAFDRSTGAPGDASWNLEPPDGNITIGDIGAAVVQFGHSCTGEDGLATAPYEMFEDMTGHSWLELEEFIADSLVPIAMDVGAGNEAIRVASGEISVACVDQQTGSKSYNLNVEGPSWGVDKVLPGDTATLPSSWQEDGIESEEDEGLAQSLGCSGTGPSTVEGGREAMHSGCSGYSRITEPSSSQAKNLARTECNGNVEIIAAVTGLFRINTSNGNVFLAGSGVDVDYKDWRAGESVTRTQQPGNCYFGLGAHGVIDVHFLWFQVHRWARVSLAPGLIRGDLT